MIRRIGGDSYPHLQQLEPTDIWEFVDPWTIDVDGYLFRFERCFRYDRSSIPELVPSWIISKENLGCAAPAVHDGLSRFGGRIPQDGSGLVTVTPWRSYTRAEADAIFREILLQRGVRPWRCWAAWAAVRIGGWRAWKG